MTVTGIPAGPAWRATAAVPDFDARGAGGRACVTFGVADTHRHRRRGNP